MRIISSLLGLLSAALLVEAQDIDPAADLNAFANNTLFNRWRPRFHFLAPAGWMNVRLPFRAVLRPPVRC